MGVGGREVVKGMGLVEFARVWKCLDNFRFGGEVLGSVLVKVRD
jgi:hypothetical protein